MTIGSEVVRHSQEADGIQTAFDFPIPAVDVNHIWVYLDGERQFDGFTNFLDSSGAGGQTVFLDAPAENSVVEHVRVTPRMQELVLENNNRLPAKDLEKELDKLILISQELAESALKYRGEWDDTTEYAVGDLVVNDDIAYIAEVANANSEPPSVSWSVFPLPAGPKGDKGDQGDTGPQGLQGIQGIQGETGPQGLQGIQGIQGETGPQGLQGIQGIQGIQGPPGNDGADGADGADGRSFVWKGAWSGATAYAVDDVVSSGGSSYICILAHTNHVPPNATYWGLMSQKGDQGVQGIQGDQGIQGIQGDPGADGADGADGVINQLQLGGSNVTTQPVLNFDDAFFDVDNAGGKNTVTFVGDTVSGTTNEIDVAAGVVGLADNAVLPGTAGVVLPSGTTAQRGSTEGQIRYNSDDDCFEYRNASAWVQLKAAANPVLVRKAADTTRTSNTLTADPDLSAPVTAGKTYDFVLNTQHTQNHSVADLRYQLTGPSGSTITFAGTQQINVSTPTAVAPTAGSTPITVDAGSGSFSCLALSGTIVVDTTAGNLAFEWGNNGGSNNTVLQAGSYLHLIPRN